jgi:hypothetical protein
MAFMNTTILDDMINSQLMINHLAVNLLLKLASTLFHQKCDDLAYRRSATAGLSTMECNGAQKLPRLLRKVHRSRDGLGRARVYRLSVMGIRL